MIDTENFLDLGDPDGWSKLSRPSLVKIVGEIVHNIKKAVPQKNRFSGLQSDLPEQKKQTVEY